MTWDVHAEGIRIPPVILYRDDKPVEDLFRLIVQNTRDTDNRTLDINAQYAGTYVGGERIIEMAKKFGREAIASAMAASLDYSERLMRAQIERIPDGVYEGSDFIEAGSGYRMVEGTDPGQGQDHRGRRPHGVRLYRQRQTGPRRRQLPTIGDLQQHLVHGQGDHRSYHSHQSGLLSAGRDHLP